MKEKNNSVVKQASTVLNKLGVLIVRGLLHCNFSVIIV